MLKLPTKSAIEQNISVCDVRINALNKIAPGDLMVALLQMQKRRNISANEVYLRSQDMQRKSINPLED